MAESGLAWREWDGEVVVRVARTGTTSLLSPSSGSVLLALRGLERPLDFGELVEHVFGVAPKSLSDDEVRSLRTTLDELGRLALVEVTPA